MTTLSKHHVLLYDPLFECRIIIRLQKSNEYEWHYLGPTIQIFQIIQIICLNTVLFGGKQERMTMTSRMVAVMTIHYLKQF